eukprot:641636-Pelagomonas_calceolata.AAC.4
MQHTFPRALLLGASWAATSSGKSSPARQLVCTALTASLHGAKGQQQLHCSTSLAWFTQGSERACRQHALCYPTWAVHPTAHRRLNAH